jgi:cytochrome c-type biogenesis protein CcmH/NrfG
MVAASSFQAVVNRAMAKDSQARFKDAGALLAALEAVIAKLPAAAVSRRPARARKKKKIPRARSSSPKRSRFWSRAIILVVVVAGSGAVATYLRRHKAMPIQTAARPAEPPPKPALPAESVAKPAVPTEPPPQAALPTESPPKAAPPTESPPNPATATEPPPPAALPSPPPTSPPPLPPAPPTASAEEKKEETAENAGDPASGSSARDPWQEAVPRALRPIRERLDRGAHMSQRALTVAYTFAHENPGDPRPWLLLGHAYAQLDWYSDSVERYRRAHEIDPASRGDPQMLADLLKAAAHPVAGHVAARAIGEIYGAEAIPELEKAMENRAGDKEVTARLTRLRASLRR